MAIIKQIKKDIHSICKEIDMVVETYYEAERNRRPTVAKYSLLFISNSIKEIIRILNSMDKEEEIGSRNGKAYKAKDMPELLLNKESLEKIRPVEMLEKWAQT